MDRMRLVLQNKINSWAYACYKVPKHPFLQTYSNQKGEPKVSASQGFEKVEQHDKANNAYNTAKGEV